MYSQAQFIPPIEPNHPVFDFPKGEDADLFLQKNGVAGWNDFMSARNKRIILEQEDPYNYSVELPAWRLADYVIGLKTWEEFISNKYADSSDCEIPIPQEWVCDSLKEAFKTPADIVYLCGGNRSSKSRYALDRCLRSLKNNPRSRMWVFHETSKMSMEYHQLEMFNLMPRVDKETGKTNVGYVAFKEQTGFSDMKFRLKNGSACEFHSYEENLKFAEGGELGAYSRERAIGYLADEKCPMNLFDKLKARIATRNAVGIHAYTPVDGYTPLVKYFRSGAKTVLKAPAIHVQKLQNGDSQVLPIVQIKEVFVEGGRTLKLAIIYFWSEWNPYGNFPALKVLHAQDSNETKLIKFYGWTENDSINLFPRLKEEVHSFKLEDLPKVGSRYMYCDPCGVHRNWFMLWVLVDPFNRKWVYREFPNIKDHIDGVGKMFPWAIDGQDNTHKYGGVPGLGSKSVGFSLQDYKKLIARFEGWNDAGSNKDVINWSQNNGARENIIYRKIDSRFAAVSAYTVKRNTTLLTECREIGLPFFPTSGKKISEGLELINSALGYTPDWKTPNESPSLFICEDCHNLWFSLKNYTALGGEKEASKDPMDVLRYAIEDNPLFIPEEDLAEENFVTGY